jgi:RNA polymerase sigma factor (sigma-70 family)
LSLQDVSVGSGQQGPPAKPGADTKAEIRSELLALLPDLRAFARFLAHDRAAADDLVQDTVVRALSALPQFQAGTNLKAWLFTILRNLFYEQVRRRRREVLALTAGFPAEEAERAAQADSAELRDLSRMLWLLSPSLREALVLVGAQELTHEEAARICGVPVGTMKARVSRARRQLARIMSEPEAPQAG